MIPTRQQTLLLFDRYELPSQKRIHVEAVTELALFFADKLIEKGIKVNKSLLEAACLLHDIDKKIPKKEGERHPETAVRVLRELGYDKVSDIVSKHSVHLILDEERKPKSWEEKLLFLADKMTKYEVIGVEHRFALWFRENLSEKAVGELNEAKPKVLALEMEVYTQAGITYEEVKKKFQI